MHYTRNLQFTEVPNYNYLRSLLKTVIKKSGFINDFYYEPHIDLKPDRCGKQISHEHKTITYNYMVVLSVYSG